MNNIKELLEQALAKETCYKHAVAVVISTLDNNYILGWNGAPTKGLPHEDCARKGYPSGEGMYLCPTVHAEIKAIAHAATDGISTKGGTMYMNEWFPCVDCGKAIIEAGLARLVTPDRVYEDEERCIIVPKLKGLSYNFEMSERLIREAGIEIIVDPSIRPEVKKC